MVQDLDGLELARLPAVDGHNFRHDGNAGASSQGVASAEAVEAVRGRHEVGLLGLVAVQGFLARRVTQGRVVAERALEQRDLLEAATSVLRGRGMVHHHVLCEPSLHAGQHFDEVLLQQQRRQLFRNLPTFLSALNNGRLTLFSI